MDITRHGQSGVDDPSRRGEMIVSEPPRPSTDHEAPLLDTNGDSLVKQVSIVLAGRHPLTLCGLRQVFERESDCVVLAVCANVENGVDAVHHYRPDLLILDVDTNDALTALRRLQREGLTSRVVVLASASDKHELADVSRLGAVVLQKELPTEAFLRCIRQINETQPALESGAVPLVTRLARSGTTTRQAIRQLTPREAEIARLAARGASTKEIANQLQVKQGTVKIHLHSIYEKLHVGGRLGLILVARRRGLA